MKKLFILLMALFLLAACSREEITGGDRPDGHTAVPEPHFYGVAMLENPAPTTRGVANQLKVWNKTFVKNLTVKFLDGEPGYQAFVREVAKEWENVADIRFVFVEPTEKALIRVAFNKNRGMMSSWR